MQEAEDVHKALKVIFTRGWSQLHHVLWGKQDIALEFLELLLANQLAILPVYALHGSKVDEGIIPCDTIIAYILELHVIVNVA